MMILVLLYCLALLITNAIVPFPFMDERFHYKQFMHWHLYKRYREYDPMITTPPGLYILPLLVYYAYNSISISWLRVLNIIYLMILRWSVPRVRRWIVLSQPLVAFYGSLYYTDVAALSFCVLHSRLLLMKNQTTVTRVLSFIVGLMALLTRQTSIVWIGFSFLLVVFNLKMNILKAKWQFMITLLHGALFALFLVINKGIAIGDKQHHQACLHFPQLFYCMIVIVLLNWPSINIIQLFKRFWKPHYALLVAPIVLLFHYNTIEHPYLFNDDRHLVNILWRFVLQYEECRLAVAGILALPAAFIVYSSVMEKRGHLAAAAFLLAFGAVVVPSPLIEPRYYMMPAVMHSLLIKGKRDKRLQLAWNLVLSVILYGLFWRTSDPARPDYRHIL